MRGEYQIAFACVLRVIIAIEVNISEISEKKKQTGFNVYVQQFFNSSFFGLTQCAHEMHKILPKMLTLGDVIDGNEMSKRQKLKVGSSEIFSRDNK